MKSWRLYAVLDTETAGNRDLGALAIEAIKGGADIIQLRAKNKNRDEVIQLAMRLRDIAWKRGVPFIINDDPALAVQVGADGAHIGQGDIPVVCARDILGRKKILGVSTHSLEEAKQAQDNGADYISVGPVFATPLKKGTKPVGTQLIQQVKSKIEIPFVAIGGININTIEKAISAGAERFAVIRAVCCAEDAAFAASTLKTAITK